MKRGWIAAAVISVLLILVGFLKMREYGNSPPHWQQKNMQHARSLAIACRGFAGDNSGVFPNALEELCPSWLDEGDLRRLGFYTPGRKMPDQWIYRRPEGDGRTNPVPMIVAPQRIRNHLVIAYSDGSVLLTKSDVKL